MFPFSCICTVYNPMTQIFREVNLHWKGKSFSVLYSELWGWSVQQTFRRTAPWRSLGEKNGDIPRAAWFVILLSCNDSCLLCIPAERSRGDRDLVVSHLLKAEIDRLQMIVNNVEEKLRAVNRQGEGALITNLIDTEHLLSDLQSKASQRNTALGQMGCGK